MLYDISLSLDENLEVWPSDPPLKYKPFLELEKGHPVNITAIETTSHLGSHVVCPFMTDQNNPSIGEIELNNFIGRCQVVEVQLDGEEKVRIEHLPSKIEATRLLIKTRQKPLSKTFDPNFHAFEPSVLDFLAEQKVKLLGLDTPSLDLYGECTEVLSQKRASYYNMNLLFNLELHKVPVGYYELIALPLRFIGLEASPVRAILRKL